MKAFEIGAFGLDGLALVDRQKPSPGPSQALIRMRACSLNYRDLLTVKGHYNPRQPLPLVPLSDGVGEVVEVGPGVSRIKVGDRVAGAFLQGWISGPIQAEDRATTLGGPLSGMLTEFRVLDESGLVQVPDYLSDEEAACLPCAAVTAWNALIEQGGLRAGQTVLVLGTGGVSIFALQIARAAGARVLVTSSSDEKLEKVESLGAAATVNYRTVPDWDRRIRELTDGAGVDHVVEVGGADTMAKSLNAVKLGGQISLIGVLAGVKAEVPVTSILMNHVRVQGILVGSRAMFEAMNSAFALHAIRPVIDRIFGFEDAPDALAYLESAGHLGKIVVRVA